LLIPPPPRCRPIESIPSLVQSIPKEHPSLAYRKRYKTFYGRVWGTTGVAGWEKAGFGGDFYVRFCAFSQPEAPTLIGVPGQ